MENVENLETLKTLYGDEECECIHPDSRGWILPSGYLRENIRSTKDPICNFCGDRCQGKNDGPRMKFLQHKLGDDFIYCPIKSRAFRVPDQKGGFITNLKLETCPLEAGGCGLAIPQDNDIKY